MTEKYCNFRKRNFILVSNKAIVYWLEKVKNETFESFYGYFISDYLLKLRIEMIRILASSQVITLKYSFYTVLVVLFTACNCNNIDCETGPPPLEVQLVDGIGNDPIASGTLVLQDIELRRLQKPDAVFSVYINGVISFSLDDASARYALTVKKIPVDTMDITIVQSQGECCTSFSVSKVAIDGTSVAFRPLKIRI